MALTDNLVLYYKLDETSGTNADDAASTHDGTFSGAVTWEAGKINNCATTSTSRSLDTGVNAAEAADFSISLWLKTSATDNYICGTADATDNKGFGVKLASGKLALLVGNGAGWTANDAAFSTDTVNSGSFVHVVITHDNSTGDWKSYINGALDKTVNAAISDDGRNLFFFNRSGGTGFSGSLDEIAYYEGKVLNLSEVQQLYNSGSGFAYPFATNVTFNAVTLTLSTTSGEPAYFIQANLLTLDSDLSIPKPSVVFIYKTGGIGTSVINTNYPNTDGIIARVTTQKGHIMQLKAEQGSFVPARYKKGL